MEIPVEVKNVLEELNKAGFEAFAVGGCVRDLLLEKEPKDWDVTTNAAPEEIQKIFPKNFYNNNFGTVTVLTDAEEKKLGEIEVTTYRVDGEYGDQRRPKEVKFTASLEEDLARRDFTVNAMALAGSEKSTAGSQNMIVINDMQIVDPFGGLRDLNDKKIRAVGEPAERFAEDALRLLRAVRLATELGFAIEEATHDAIRKHAADIKNVSFERVRDELTRIVMSKNPEAGFEHLRKTGLLQEILPEVAAGIGVDQNKHHKFTVYEHNVKSLQFAANYDYPLHVRLSALFHDIGKVRTRRFDKAQNDYTFYAHDIVGAKITQQVMKRLKFSGEMIKQVSHLVRYHMFYYDVGKVTEAGARRLLKRVGGSEKFADLIKLRIAERKGSGVPKAEPYRLRHLQFLVEKAAQEPISVNQLAVNGGDLIKELKLKPGPTIGGILNALLAEVLEDPKKNDKKYLLEKAEELKDKNPQELKQMGADATEEAEARREEEIKRKYHV